MFGPMWIYASNGHKALSVIFQWINSYLMKLRRNVVLEPDLNRIGANNLDVMMFRDFIGKFDLVDVS